MPVYEYKCTICNEHFEVEQSIKDNTLETIPGDDHEHTVKKVFHAPGIAFKGDGFYKNDARKSTEKKSSGNGSSSSSDSGDTKSSDSSTKSTPSSSSDSSSSSSSSSSSTTTSSNSSSSD